MASRPNTGAKVHADILAALIRAPSSIAELTTATGYLRTTVTSWIDELETRGIVGIVDERKTKGQRARVFALKPILTHRAPSIDFETRPPQTTLGADEGRVWTERRAA